MSSDLATGVTGLPDSVALPAQKGLTVQPSLPAHALKRATDVIIALFTLVLLLPLMALIAIVIKLTSPGPVIFRQLRIGRQGQSFMIYKFRTMRDGAPLLLKEDVRAGAADKHITRIGRILRRLSLDELPQLINVLKGDMSLIGPRPATHAQTERTCLRMQHPVILLFRPGMTGLAQTEGRGNLNDEDTVVLDLEYCKNWTWWLDWRIIFATFAVVLSRRGAY